MLRCVNRRLRKALVGMPELPQTCLADMLARPVPESRRVPRHSILRPYGRVPPAGVFTNKKKRQNPALFLVLNTQKITVTLAHRSKLSAIGGEHPALLCRMPP
jgi:hypothetical protein